MKTLFVIALLFIAGCLPASQQEVLDLTNTVNQIVPLVREVVATSSDDTKDKIEIVLGQVERVNEAVATADDPVEAVKSGVAASSPFNPYAVPILVGISIFEAVGIFREMRKSTGLEKGLSRVKGEAEPELAKKIHDTMKIYTG